MGPLRQSCIAASILCYLLNGILRWFNPLKTKPICVIQELSPYLAVNTVYLGYTNQTVNVKIKCRCSEIHTEHTKCNVITMQNF